MLVAVVAFKQKIFYVLRKGRPDGLFVQAKDTWNARRDCRRVPSYVGSCSCCVTCCLLQSRVGYRVACEQWRADGHNGCQRTWCIILLPMVVVGVDHFRIDNKEYIKPI
jgi:hypothetical protein